MKKTAGMSLGSPIVLSDSDPKIWEQVTSAKHHFIKTGNLPEHLNYIPREILLMWEWSKKYGIDCSKPPDTPSLSHTEFSLLLERKQLLIDVAMPFIEEFQDILDHTNFLMSLCDETGVMLIRPKVIDKSIDLKPDIEPGAVWSEKYVGCTAHTLALAFNRPAQIMGPANYLDILTHNISSAAPIFNEYGDTVGSIMLVQKQASSSTLMEHSLGWVTAVASAISSQLKLFRRDRRLKLMNSTLKATFAHIDDGYVSIDESGYIININKEAIRLLKLDPENTKINFLSVFKDNFSLTHALQTSRTVLCQKMQLKSDESVEVLMDIEPYQGERKHSAHGAIIKVSKKLKTASQEKSNITSSISFDRIIGKCSVMENLINTAKIVAERPINILLLGESGTGKEVFAQAIHNHYNKTGPFVAINCASLPPSLIESELFGYERGAFTGAEKAGRKGKIEYADGGTLFLDEIGDMPIELQPVLLRVLQEKQVVRLGGHKSIPVDFRIISATNRPLCDNIFASKFRRDLYFRLAVVNLELPPLRERNGDVLLLADNFIRITCERFEMPQYALSPEVEKILLQYNWPGNVRELENAMIYAVAIAKNCTITPDDLPKDILKAINDKTNTKMNSIKDMEKEMILKILNETGSVQDTARQLGVSRTTIYRKVRN